MASALFPFPPSSLKRDKALTAPSSLVFHVIRITQRYRLIRLVRNPRGITQ